MCTIIIVGVIHLVVSLKRKSIVLTIAEKVNITNKMIKSGKFKNEIAKQFNVPRSNHTE